MVLFFCRIGTQRKETISVVEGNNKYGTVRMTLDMMADPFLFVRFDGESETNFHTVETEFQIQGQENHRWSYQTSEGIIQGSHRGGDVITHYAATLPEALKERLYAEAMATGKATSAHRTSVIKTDHNGRDSFSRAVQLNFRRAVNNGKPYGPVFFAAEFEPAQYTSHIIRPIENETVNPYDTLGINPNDAQIFRK